MKDFVIVSLSFCKKAAHVMQNFDCAHSYGLNIHCSSLTAKFVYHIVKNFGGKSLSEFGN